jgi:hypothetical protein
VEELEDDDAAAEAAGFDSDFGFDSDEDDPADESDALEDDDEAGVLLDEEPRLSFR